MSVGDLSLLSCKLIEKLPILSGITSKAEHKEALAVMDMLIEDYDTNLVIIEALSIVIARYETESVEFEVFNKLHTELDSAVTTLKVLMDQYGLDTTDLATEIGSQHLVSQVLAGNKKLTKFHIQKLAQRFGISPAKFF